MAYYTDKIREKFRAALRAARDELAAGAALRVSVSRENSKMGPVVSVSLLPFITCPACCATTCGPLCYAAKIANLYPAALRAYAVNTALLMDRPAEYWTQVRAAIAGARFFRFHVSGDIPGPAYLENMIRIAQEFPGTEILCFTKRFDVVNAQIYARGPLPANLHILFSGWTNLTPPNPHRLPETNVIERGAEPAPGWTVCGGNCYECATTGAGCWKASSGDVIAFHVH